jgi:ketosteroid isomerase-like protein
MKIFIACMTITIIAGFKLPARPVAKKTGPTVENALAADRQFAMALQNNDTLGIVRLLDKDWAVITSHGDIAEGPDVYPNGIRTGHRIVTKMELREPRVRLFGNVAVVTTKVRLGVASYGEFDLRQTDTWLWKNGAWKCILQHESNLANP